MIKAFQLALFLSTIHIPIFAQQKDSLKTIQPLVATANIQVTNNGISLFPNLSLGKPATVINVSVGKKHLFFEPELRWGLNGKPWSYIFWLRYKSKKKEHFSYHFGVHPAYIIREDFVIANGKLDKRYFAQRYFAGEVVPVYHHSSQFLLAVHVLKAKSLDINTGIQRSTFLSIQPRFPKIVLSEKYHLGYFPQVFHLALDKTKGSYYSQYLTLNKKSLPVYLSSVFTSQIKSTVPGDKVVWNVGLNLKL